MTVLTSKDATELLLRGSLALARAERNGVRVDVARMKANMTDTHNKITALELAMKNTDVWRAWSRRFGEASSLTKNEQLAEVLYDDFDYEVKITTAKGKRGTSSIALEHIDHPFMKDFALWKALGTLAKKLDGLERELVGEFLHPDFNLQSTTTFRSSSGRDRELGLVDKAGFNFQNIPNRNPIQSKPIRDCFVPRPGHRIAEMDFGAHEFKVAASVWADEAMIDYASDPKKCVHFDWTARCYGCSVSQVSKDMRTHGKNKFVFPILYGSYWKSCARDLWEATHKFSLKLKDNTPLTDHLASKGIRSLEALEKHVEKVEHDFYRAFPTFAERKDAIWADYRRTGEVRLITGITLRGCFSRNFVLNSQVQGPAFHCLLWSLTRIQEWLDRHGMKSLLLGQIHDCILFDLAPGEEQDVLDAANWYMTVGIRKHWPWVVVPLLAELDVTEVDAPWSEKKSWINLDSVWQLKPKEKK